MIKNQSINYLVGSKFRCVIKDALLNSLKQLQDMHNIRP